MSAHTTYNAQSALAFKKSISSPRLLLLASMAILLLASIIISTNGFWLVNFIQAQLMQKSSLTQTGLRPLLQITTVRENIGFVITFALLFLLYFLALHYLPRQISSKYILFSTLLLGFFYMLMPIVTSQDVFSYIAYTRMNIFYHLNPLTTTPMAIKGDPIYYQLYWTNQPSIYGPTWVFITGTLQQIALLIGFKHILSMELLLRLWGLLIHLGSSYLVIQLGRQIYQSLHNKEVLSEDEQQNLRRAALAFAWNPFLLLEACVNAHNDTTILFLILAGIYFLSPRMQRIPGAYLLTAVLLALATCLKITMLVLFPGLLLFLWLRPREQVQGIWTRRISEVVGATVLYAAIIMLLYVPFWQNGELLHILLVTPGTSRDINSLYESLVRIYAYIANVYISPDNVDTGSWVEAISHQISTVIFVIAYGLLCLRSLLAPRTINTLPALVRWMALAWFIYCLLGSPWFWPWYTITFLGLAAVVEPNGGLIPFTFKGKPFNSAIFARVLSISMLSMYCFALWSPDTSVAPFLPHLRWMYLRGLLIWLPPFVALFAAMYLLPRLYASRDTDEVNAISQRSRGA